MTLPTDPDAVAVDLLGRCNTALTEVARLVADTGVTFSANDVVERVENQLPEGYSEATRTDAASRRGMITDTVIFLLSCVAAGAP